MVANWTDTNANTRGKKDIKRHKLDNDSRIRLTGGVLPRYIYWLVTKEGKKHPIECLSFDRTTESFTDAPDPMKELPEEIYNEKPQFAYLCQGYDRKGNTGLGIIDLKTTIYKGIVSYARNKEYGNPADDEAGYDLTIKKEKTGPLPQNVKYSVQPGRAATPLTAEERSEEKYDLEAIYKRPTYEEQKRWLLENTTYFAAMTGGEQEAAADLPS
jgi:hypothetical protein